MLAALAKYGANNFDMKENLFDVLMFLFDKYIKGKQIRTRRLRKRLQETLAHLRNVRRHLSGSHSAVPPC